MEEAGVFRLSTWLRPRHGESGAGAGDSEEPVHGPGAAGPAEDLQRQDPTDKRGETASCWPVPRVPKAHKQMRSRESNSEEPRLAFFGPELPRFIWPQGLVFLSPVN